MALINQFLSGEKLQLYLAVDIWLITTQLSKWTMEVIFITRHREGVCKRRWGGGGKGQRSGGVCDNYDACSRRPLVVGAGRGFLSGATWVGGVGAMSSVWQHHWPSRAAASTRVHTHTHTHTRGHTHTHATHTHTHAGTSTDKIGYFCTRQLSLCVSTTAHCVPSRIESLTRDR